MTENNSTTHTRQVHTHMATPVGRLTLVATDDGLAAILWENDRPHRVRVSLETEARDHPVLVEAERQLAEYFAGRRQQFTLTLDVTGTAFQRQVWHALRTIPFGETRSYGEIARLIGRPGAVRAVGAANGRNPISIVTPCHRVVGSTGALTGFAGGLDVKARLLAFEGARLPGGSSAPTLDLQPALGPRDAGGVDLVASAELAHGFREVVADGSFR